MISSIYKHTQNSRFIPHLNMKFHCLPPKNGSKTTKRILMNDFPKNKAHILRFSTDYPRKQTMLAIKRQCEHQNST